MCLSPIWHDGKPIWCRKCERCRRNRVNDWVGRCIAEAMHATKTHSVTLTYGRDKNNQSDHVHSALLVYSDVQKYFKKLRFDGYKFKYLVAGEYGSKNRRAHWHVLIFWDGASPQVELNTEHYLGHYDYWDWGTTYWEAFTPSSVWYVCKYIQKQQGDDEAESKLRMSKKPPLGHEYFRDWARQHVRDGLAPQSLHYSFEGVCHKDGKRRQYYMQGVTADNFIREYVLEHIRQKGHTRMPYSELVSDWVDAKFAADDERILWMEREEHGQALKTAEQKIQLRQRAEPHGGVEAFYSLGIEGVDPGARCADGIIVYLSSKPETWNEKFIRIITAK